MSELFAPVPYDVLDVIPSGGALIVYCHLMRLRNWTTNTTPPVSLDTLAASCRISKRSVTTHIRALEAANLIVVNSGGGCNSYTVVLQKLREPVAKIATYSYTDSDSKQHAAAVEHHQPIEKKLPQRPKPNLEAQPSLADSPSEVLPPPPSSAAPPAPPITEQQAEMVKLLYSAGVHSPQAEHIAASHSEGDIRAAVAGCRRANNPGGYVVAALKYGWHSPAPFLPAHYGSSTPTPIANAEANDVPTEANEQATSPADVPEYIPPPKPQADPLPDGLTNPAIGSYASVSAAWEMAYGILALQIDRAKFQSFFLRSEFLGYHAATNTIYINVHGAYARDMLQDRLYRNVRRTLTDVAGDSTIEIKFVVGHKSATINP